MKELDLIGNKKQYEDFLGNSFKVECIGCSQGAKEVNPPGGIIYETNNFILNQDPYVPIKGFLIVASKKHYQSLIEFSDDQRIELINLINLGMKLLKDNNISKEISIIQEERSNHFHIWLFPWHDWMNDRFKKGISEIRDICEYAQANVTNEEKKEIIDLVNYLRNKI